MIPENETDVAFILVNYNTGKYLFDLLDFFAKETPGLPFTYKVIVVDNNSTDGSPERLMERGGAQLIRNKENLGYAKAVNIGIKAAQSKYICVLNMDLEMDEATLPALWDFMEKNPEARMCSPVIYSSNGKVQGFLLKLNSFFLYAELLKSVYLSWMKAVVGRSKKPVSVDGVAGTFLFFRSMLVPSDKKLFDEDYFFYFEDADLAMRLKKSGVRTYIIPGTHVAHFGSPTDVEFHWELFYRNKYLYLRKNYGAIHAGIIRKLDRMKVLGKLFKYALLKRVYPGKKKRVLAKYGHYKDMASRLEELNY